MKRFLVIPIMFLYLLAVSGVMINLHYCGKTLENWSVYTQSKGCDDGACEDEEQEADGCCENKVIASKVSHDQHVAAFLKLVIAPAEWALTTLYYSNDFSEAIHAPSLKLTSHQPNAPPGLWENIPLYKLHSRLTYYG